MSAITHSIVIPTKDRPNLLRRAVASAQAALAEGGEIVIVDDGGTIPATTALADLQDKRLRIVRHEVSAGASAARNTGLTQARGPVVFLLDDDDALMPGYVRQILNGPAQSHDYGFCCCHKTFAATGVVQKSRPNRPSGPIPQNAPLRHKMFATCMGVWLRRDAAARIGGFDTGLVIGEDTDFACRLIRAGLRGWYSAEVGVMIHIHNAPNEQAHVGQSRSTAQAAADLGVVSQRYPEFATYLGPKYLRLCAAARLDAQAVAYIRAQHSPTLRLWFSLLYRAKSLRYRLRRPRL